MISPASTLVGDASRLDTPHLMTLPAQIVIFGASGDLTRRKLVPALARLAADGRVKQPFSILGVSRTVKTDEAFRNELAAALPESERRRPDALPACRRDRGLLELRRRGARPRQIGPTWVAREAGPVADGGLTLQFFPARLWWSSLASAIVFAMTCFPELGRARALESEVDRLVGTYRFVGGQKEIREVERAIDEAVDEMSFLIRGIARKRLKEPNLPTDEVQISLGNGKITISRSGQPAIAAPATGEVVTWRNPRNGNELEVTHRVTKAGALEQRLVGDRGVSTNLFSLSKEGRLVLKTTIDADKLPSTIRFSTTYARK